MTIARSTLRTATENRLIALASSLDGFTDQPHTEGLWLVTPPFTSKQLPNRRLLVIGAPDGLLNPDGIAKSAGPTVDTWGIAAGLVCTEISESQAAKQAVEDAFNTFADAIAADPRLGMNPGPRDLSIPTAEGPLFAFDEQAIPTAWMNFDIQCFADIERNRP